MAVIKIQIKSMAVLEKLIGGDDTFAIEIRNSLVDEFSKKYLKSLVTTEAMRKVSSLMSAEVAGYVKENVGNYSWNDTFPRLKEGMAKKIDEQVKVDIDQMIRDSVARYKESLQKIVKEYDESQIYRALDQQLSEKILDVVRTRVDEKLKEILGPIKGVIDQLTITK